MPVGVINPDFSFWNVGNYVTNQKIVAILPDLPLHVGTVTSGDIQLNSALLGNGMRRKSLMGISLVLDGYTHRKTYTV